jgi:hypothetical protein
VVLDDNTTRVLLAFFGLLNTALLVWNATRLAMVHSAVDGATKASEVAAHASGVVAGILASQHPVGEVASIPHPPPPTAQ